MSRCRGEIVRPFRCRYAGKLRDEGRAAHRASSWMRRRVALPVRDLHGHTFLPPGGTEVPTAAFGATRSCPARRPRRPVMALRTIKRSNSRHCPTRLKLKVSLASRLDVPSATRELACVPQRNFRGQQDRLHLTGTVVKGGPEGRIGRKRRVDNPERNLGHSGLPWNSTPRGWVWQPGNSCTKQPWQGRARHVELA